MKAVLVAGNRVLVTELDPRERLTLRKSCKDRYLQGTDENGAETYSVQITRQTAMSILGIVGVFDGEISPDDRAQLKKMATADLRTLRESVANTRRVGVLEWPDGDSAYYEIHDQIDTRIPGRSYCAASESDFRAVYFPLEGPASGEACEAALTIINDWSFVGPNALIAEIRQKAEEFAAEEDALEKQLSEIEIAGMTKKLFPYQAAGVGYIALKKRVLLCDPMRSGKTLQALAAMQFMNAWPVLVLAPNEAVKVWERELNESFPDRVAVRLRGREGEWGLVAGADLIICTHDILGNKNVREALRAARFMNSATQEFGAVLVDESHHLKETDTRRWRLAEEVMRNVPVRVCITGTPLPNRPEELIGQLRLIDRLEDMGGSAAFRARYRDVNQNAWLMRDLNRRLRKVCMIRRSEELVKAVLKSVGKEFGGGNPRTFSEVPMSPEAWANYQKAQHDFVDWVKEKIIRKPEVQMAVAGMSDSDAADYVAMLARQAEARQNILTYITVMRYASGQSKAPQIVERVNDWLDQTDPSEKMVIFAHYRDTVEKLVMGIEGCVAIVGSQSPDLRQKQRDRFATDPTIRVAVMSVTLAEGVTMAAANTALFAEMDWSPMRNKQAEARLHAIGKSRPSDTDYVLAVEPDGEPEDFMIDRKMHQLTERKRVIIEATEDGADATAQDDILGDLIRDMIRQKVYNLAE